MIKKETIIKNVTFLTAFLIIVWGFYRLLFKLPEEIEEMAIKPLVWLIPVLYLVYREKAPLSSVGITGKKIFPSIYSAILLGMFFAIEGALINFVKYDFNFKFTANFGENAFWAALVLSLATAVSEELTFRGYLFTRILDITGDEWKTNLITTGIWCLIHIPIAILWWGTGLTGLVGYMLLIGTFSLGSGFIFAKTGNIISSILLHVFWSWPIMLFR